MSEKAAGKTKKTTESKTKGKDPTPEKELTEAPVSGPIVNLDDLGELPRTYGSDTIFLVAQEPHWLFTYWDIDISRHPGGPSFLRVYEGDEHVESEIEVPFETRNWYIPVKVAGASYTVEIGYYRSNVWNTIARSMAIQTPPDRLSNSSQFEYATIPLHLSFQRLMENIQTTLHSGESLIQALSRLQKDGKLFPVGSGALPNLSHDELAVLEALLGKGLLEELSSSGLSSEQIEARIREHLEEKLSSAGASELLAGSSMSSWNAPESSLFSALSALSSSGMSSWSAGALSSWAAAALTSWAAAAQATSSWGAETTGSWTQAAQSSWGAASLSSWLQAAKTSWEQAALSSWSQSAMSSETLAAVTSWSEAAVTSWGGASGSEWVSSFGQERKFFMHVNAEVIFYGGTDPKAKVTIDGKPITLNPDGTFRYHFIFPDGTYEIPIVATSPDGVETRSALLRFERGTEKQGKVDDTAQPPLASPMGASS